MPDSNRRHSPRYEIGGVQGSMDRRQCELLRLSLTGLLAAGTFHPEPQKVIHLEFPLGGETFHSVGRVAFVGPDIGRSERGWSRVGIEFTAMSRRSRVLLESYLHDREPVDSPA